MRPTVLAFSGAIASGKTTLSARVAELLGWPRVAFGDYVRAVATARGLAQAREVLQALGADLIAQLGWEDFCRSVLVMGEWAPGRSLVIDGVRHAEAVSVLRALVAPSEFLLVLVTTPVAVRWRRLAERDGAGISSLHPDQAHMTEKQVAELLPSLAHLTVDGAGSPEATAITVIEWVRDRQRTSG